MSRIVLARHGETIWHAENRYAGVTDIALTNTGVSQAKRLATWASTAKLSSIWSSPLQRAVLTAQPACSATGISLQIEHRLLELNFGRCEGLTTSEMKLRFPAEYAAFEIDPVANHLPGGENPISAAERGAHALHDIARSAASDARHLVVAHNTLLRLVMCKLLNIPLSTYRSSFPSLVNGAITEFVFDGSTVELLAFNQPISDESRP